MATKSLNKARCCSTFWAIINEELTEGVISFKDLTSCSSIQESFLDGQPLHRTNSCFLYPVFRYERFLNQVYNLFINLFQLIFVKSTTDNFSSIIVQSILKDIVTHEALI